MCVRRMDLTQPLCRQSFLRDVFGSKKGTRRDPALRRQGSFLSQPHGGWLHDEFALAYGDGLYYRHAHPSLIIALR